jgi:hypothetical protein
VVVSVDYSLYKSLARQTKKITVDKLPHFANWKACSIIAHSFVRSTSSHDLISLEIVNLIIIHTFHSWKKLSS